MIGKSNKAGIIVQILVATGLGIPQQRHKGNVGEGVLAYAGQNDHQRDFVQIR